MYIGPRNIQDKALYLTGNQPLGYNNKCHPGRRGPRSTFGNKLLKNTKEVKQGLVKIYWEGTREKIL